MTIKKKKNLKDRKTDGGSNETEEKALLQQLVQTHAKMQTFRGSRPDSGLQIPQIQCAVRIITLPNVAFASNLVIHSSDARGWKLQSATTAIRLKCHMAERMAGQAGFVGFAGV